MARSAGSDSYDARQPTVCFRLPTEKLAELQAIATRKGIALSELLRRRALRVLSVERAYARGIIEAATTMPFLIDERCPACGAILTFDLTEPFDRIMLRYLNPRNCGHPDDRSARRTEREAKLQAAHGALQPTKPAKP